MNNENEQIDFSNQLEQRFDEFTQWAMKNWPDKNRPLAASSFIVCRKEIALLSSALRDPHSGPMAEPSEGGAQYVNVTPAPWP